MAKDLWNAESHAQCPFRESQPFGRQNAGRVLQMGRGKTLRTHATKQASLPEAGCLAKATCA